MDKSKILENVIKYGLLIATSPIWWPVMKALWHELQAALWREGGLIGRPPTKNEVPVLEQRYRAFLSPLINETYAEFTDREQREEEQRVEEKRRGKKRVKRDQEEAEREAARGGSAPRKSQGSPVVRPQARRAGSLPKPGGAARPLTGKANGAQSFTRGSQKSASGPRKSSASDAKHAAPKRRGF